MIISTEKNTYSLNPSGDWTSAILFRNSRNIPFARAMRSYIVPCIYIILYVTYKRISLFDQMRLSKTHVRNVTVFVKMLQYKRRRMVGGLLTISRRNAFDREIFCRNLCSFLYAWRLFSLFSFMLLCISIRSNTTWVYVKIRCVVAR